MAIHIEAFRYYGDRCPMSSHFFSDNKVFDPRASAIPEVQTLNVLTVSSGESFTQAVCSGTRTTV